LQTRFSPAHNHDFDFARPAGRSSRGANIRTDAASNYDDSAGIEANDMLVSYTSQVPVSDEACAALRPSSTTVARDSRQQLRRDNVHLPNPGSKFITH
jgi:hypothetical protein